MRIAVSGVSGLVGSVVAPSLVEAGHEVVAMVRRPVAAGEKAIRWDPSAGTIDARALEGFDAVIHLAGESIGSGRWTASRKAAIRDSRVKGTSLLCGALAGLSKPPGTLVCASAIGIYGDRGITALTEDSPAGTGFLPDVCREWEAASEPAARKGVRVVNLRLGVVLTPKGGALQRMLPIFRAGLGGVLGSGKQYVSWVALDDVPGIVSHVLAREDLSGPVNAVATRPVTNRELTEALGKLLSRPVLLPVPAFALRLAVGGEMANALLLSSCRVVCRRLLDTGYRFRYPEIWGALRHLLGQPD